MKRPLILAALAIMTVSAAVPAEAQRRAAAARPAPARVDWVRTAVRTPQGGVRIGNPAAPVKLVEYGSITCPHCAHFAQEATRPLYAHVRTGRVSWEYRPFMLFPTDPPVFALLNCQAPGFFFATVEQLYASQPAWSGLAQTYIENNRTQLMGMSIPARGAALVRAGQIDRVFAARGMTPRQISACVGSQANLERVANLTRRAAQTDNVQGTPSFFINGSAARAGTWGDLEPMLIRAGARR